MTLPAVGSATYPTVAEIRDSILRTIKLGFQRVGLSANVLEGSENYVRADATARRVVHAFANNRIALQDYSPLTAQGDNLVLVARVYGVEKRARRNSASIRRAHIATRSTSLGRSDNSHPR